jgi:hypothetical protein
MPEEKTSPKNKNKTAIYKADAKDKEEEDKLTVNNFLTLFNVLELEFFLTIFH